MRGWAFIRDLERLWREAMWWGQYMERLTPKERKQLRRSDYHALWRPAEPDFAEGDVLEVTPRLHIRIADIEPRRGKWRITIDHVWDFRAPASQSVRGKKTFESVEGATTLAHTSGNRVGEPEGVEADNRRSRLRWATSAQEAIIGHE